MINLPELSISSFVDHRNEERILFTAGPGSLLCENIAELRPCFGRGDDAYLTAEADVMRRLERMSGHSNLVRMQGSASLALEVVSRNFLFGRVLVVETGFYSNRLRDLANAASQWPGEVRKVEQIGWESMEAVSGQFEWVFACSTETSTGLRVPIDQLRGLSDRLGAKLALDATASIGLESGHELADVLAYSSCKGLFGLTGAAFVASHELPSVEVNSFYLSYSSHRSKLMTGPLHSILSLAGVLPQHDNFREAVVINKRLFLERMRPWLALPDSNQPLLCTRLSRRVKTQDPAVVLYSTRFPIEGSVICHLGEIHLGKQAKGAILETLELCA